MKKTLIMLLALVVPASLWGMDINQGRFEVSGATAFNISDTTAEVSGEPDIDTTTWEIEVDGNYYIQKNVGLGLFLSYESIEEEQAGVSNDSSFFAFGPQAIYNLSLNDKVSLFVNGGIGYVTAEVDNNDADGFGFMLRGGLKYFVTSAASLNGAIQYQNFSLEDDFNRDLDISGVSFGVGLSLYF